MSVTERVNRTIPGTRILASVMLLCALTSGYAQEQEGLIRIDTKRILLTVDPVTCRWSAQIKETEMRIHDVHFLPGDDPSGWTVQSSVSKNDATNLGSFVTVTLHGVKPGQLDFDYSISADKVGTDIVVSLGRSNNTGRTVDIQDMDYFMSDDAELGGTYDRWMSLGTQSQNRELYALRAVVNLITSQMYIVNHVVRDEETGNSLLLGHVTTMKGSSRFEVASGWGGKVGDRMRVRGYCSYKVSMPPGKSFAGEKLLISFTTDALRAMEHQADLIAIAHDVRLKQRRPINCDDRELVANDYSRYHGWMSGGTQASAEKFLKDNGLVDFYYGVGGPARSGSWGVYGSGGSTFGRPSRVNYPPECFLPIHTVKYLGERVIDFSNPLTVTLERERALAWVVGQETMTGRVEMDFSDWWDKWPGQYDPYVSALEAYHAGGAPWREVLDQKASRMVIRSNMAPVDYSYGLVDILRVSEDADQGYEDLESAMSETEFTGLFAETVGGSAIRFFYNGRVFWNDGDGFHIYKYRAPHGKVGSYDYGQAKVVANFRAMSSSTLLVSEAFDEPYPADRLELLKRISPPTMDVSYPVDLFVRKPARIWNMPLERPFGKWCVVGVFNYTNKTTRDAYGFTAHLDAAKDLRLDSTKEYIVYEFWSKKLIGTFKGSWITRPLNPYDCDIYSIVEKQDHPVLISTSRHIRQMAFDIKELAYDAKGRILSGTSRAVPGDQYQLRIYVPNGFKAGRVEMSDGSTATLNNEGNLLTVDWKTSSPADMTWRVIF